MRKLALLLLLVPGTITFSQSDLTDVIYLKNGGIIRGKIIEITPQKTLKIETECRNIFVYNIDEIDKTSKEPVILQGENSDTSDRRLEVEVNFGALLRNIKNNNYYYYSNSREIPLSANLITSYRFYKGFSGGMGGGLDIFDQTVIPLFLDIKYISKLNSYIFPFFNLQGGFSLPLDDSYFRYQYQNGYAMGGPMFNIGVGIRLKQTKVNNFEFSISFRYQQLQYHQKAGWQSEARDIFIIYKPIAIRIGLTF